MPLLLQSPSLMTTTQVFSTFFPFLSNFSKFLLVLYWWLSFPSFNGNLIKKLIY
jgi:hypothetical protein